MTAQTDIVETEPYTTTDGILYTLTRWSDPAAHEPWPSEFWSWRDARGWGPGLGSLADRHLTREAAIERLEAKLRIDRLGGSFEKGTATPFETREGYEAACAVADQEPLSDADCDSYGVKYGQFTMPQYQADHIIRMRLARRRQIALERAAADRARERAAQTPVEVISCPNCGRPTYPSNLMNASLGTACPECYDELAG